MWERFSTYSLPICLSHVSSFYHATFSQMLERRGVKIFLFFLIPTGLPWNQCTPGKASSQGNGQWKSGCYSHFWGGPYHTACGILAPSCSSVTKSCLTLCDSMDCSTPGFPVLHHLPELTQTHVHWIAAAIQPFHPLLPPSPAFSLSQHQGLFQWVGSLHQVAKVFELQLQHQPFQWIFRVDFL